MCKDFKRNQKIITSLKKNQEFQKLFTNSKKVHKFPKMFVNLKIIRDFETISCIQKNSWFKKKCRHFLKSLWILKNKKKLKIKNIKEEKGNEKVNKKKRRTVKTQRQTNGPVHSHGRGHAFGRYPPVWRWIYHIGSPISLAICALCGLSSAGCALCGERAAMSPRNNTTVYG